MGHRLSPGLGIALSGLGVLILALFALSFGQYPISLAEVWTALVSEANPRVETIVTEIRLPRVVSAILVGAALAAAGATYQGLFRNPLVSPDILGVSSGAGLGAVLAIYLSLPVIAIQGMAFGFGLGAVFLVYGIARTLRGTHDPMLVLVLAGIVMGTLFGACISLLTYLADPYDQLPAIAFWMLGSLASVKNDDLVGVIWPILLGLIPLVLLRWRINLMALGDADAKALGLETGRLRILIVASATLITAAAVSVTGIVGWVGLVVPHLARMLVGPNFMVLLPASLLMGGGYLLGVDTVARTLADIEIPLGVLNAFIGAPFFLLILARARKVWQ
ncbi:MAG: FecCD family ABC transporter permease [Magnetovibrionaceae bacterium]